MVEMFDPAALGGLAGLIALAGWSIGRLQGRWRDEHKAEASDLRAIAAQTQVGEGTQSALPAPAATAVAPAPCQQRAREERRALLARSVSLAELHDEARAIRKDAGILRDIGAGEELVLHRQGAARIDCPYLGSSGLPTCPGALAASCKDSAGCALTPLARAATSRQPGADLSSLTRV